MNIPPTILPVIEFVEGVYNRDPLARQRLRDHSALEIRHPHVSVPNGTRPVKKLFILRNELYPKQIARAALVGSLSLTLRCD